MLLPENTITKYTIENKAEEYGTAKWGYKNENQDKYEDSKEDFKRGYLKALNDLKLLFTELT